MTTKILCGSSPSDLEKFANDSEKNGFVPISMANKVLDNRNVTCILMHKKE
jgi:hypothetical protein